MKLFSLFPLAICLASATNYPNVDFDKILAADGSNDIQISYATMGGAFKSGSNDNNTYIDNDCEQFGTEHGLFEKDEIVYACAYDQKQRDHKVAPVFCYAANETGCPAQYYELGEKCTGSEFAFSCGAEKSKTLLFNRTACIWHEGSAINDTVVLRLGGSRIQDHWQFECSVVNGTVLRYAHPLNGTTTTIRPITKVTTTSSIATTKVPSTSSPTTKVTTTSIKTTSVPSTSITTTRPFNASTTTSPVPGPSYCQKVGKHNDLVEEDHGLHVCLYNKTDHSHTIYPIYCQVPKEWRLNNITDACNEHLYIDEYCQGNEYAYYCRLSPTEDTIKLEETECIWRSPLNVIQIHLKQGEQKVVTIPVRSLVIMQVVKDITYKCSAIDGKLTKEVVHGKERHVPRKH